MLAQEIAGESRTTIAQPPSSLARQVRTIRVGLLGLGNVGQAVARLAPDAHRLESCGVRFKVTGALVRDVTRARRCLRPPRLTSNPEAFLRGSYDVVIEALGTIEPARTLVARLLGRGIPAVTANKSLVAAHGGELAALAARRGASFRYEASALAGVPFLGALNERPYLAEVSRFTAVVNGTSNFILSTIERDGCPFDAALTRARQLGLTEPDPSRDLDGLDAADKLGLLASIFGWGTNAHATVEIRGIRELGGDDLAAARELGGTIKPVVWAARAGHGVDAFVGPAFIEARHPLASLSGTLSGIQLSGRYVTDLFFSGPGAGPDVTAATILDDAIEAVSTRRRVPKRVRRLAPCPAVRPPDTAWLVRVSYPGVQPDRSSTQALFASAGLSIVAATSARRGTQWLRVARIPTKELTRSIAELRHRHRLEMLAIRAI